MLNNIALITGATGGLGYEFAKIHASKGLDMMLVDISQEKLETMKNGIEKTYGVKAYICSADFSNVEAAQSIYDYVKNEQIEIEYLINNAGFGGGGKFYERNLEIETNMIMVNVVTLTRLTHLFLNDFVERGHGKVLNVSSAVSLMPGPLQAIYFATKAFVTSFSNSVNYELRDTGVTVTALLPGALKTDFIKTAEMEGTNIFKKAAHPKKIAEDGYEAMLQEKTMILSGVSIWERFLLKTIPFAPKNFVNKIVYNMQKK